MLFSSPGLTWCLQPVGVYPDIRQPQCRFSSHLRLRRYQSVFFRCGCGGTAPYHSSLRSAYIDKAYKLLDPICGNIWILFAAIYNNPSILARLSSTIRYHSQILALFPSSRTSVGVSTVRESCVRGSAGSGDWSARGRRKGKAGNPVFVIVLFVILQNLTSVFEWYG